MDMVVGGGIKYNVSRHFSRVSHDKSRKMDFYQKQQDVAGTGHWV
jgi:hypothetical protein